MVLCEEVVHEARGTGPLAIMERPSEYCDIAERRWRASIGQRQAELFELADPITASCCEGTVRIGLALREVVVEVVAARRRHAVSRLELFVGLHAVQCRPLAD